MARLTTARLRESVWSRKIGEGLERRDVAETLQAGSIVIVEEAVEEGIASRAGWDARDSAFPLRRNIVRWGGFPHWISSIAGHDSEVKNVTIESGRLPLLRYPRWHRSQRFRMLDGWLPHLSSQRPSALRIAIAGRGGCG